MLVTPTKRSTSLITSENTSAGTSESMRGRFFTARTSVYSLRVKAPGLPQPWYGRR